MATIAICTPHGGLVDPRYYRGITVMQTSCPQHRFIFVEVDTQIIGKARNMLIEMALLQDPKPDVVWFVDNDVLIPPTAGELVDLALNMGVVSGVYYARRPPYTPQIYLAATEPEFVGKYWPEINMPENGIWPKDAVGAGLLCIRTDILVQLQEMWTPRFGACASLLQANGYEDVANIVQGLSPWFEFLDKKGEDLYFCERLKLLGYKVWVNYDIRAQHLTVIPIDRTHFEYLVANNLIHYEDGGVRNG